ncbi:MAG: AAA family ATPase [Alphaproteobacteria bacterium]|nr:AAA family ATPase [Alphaproteobacteria bacterium]MBU0865103.1 AAA family ATPase [Alphaproteobacteria bacterium]MBU1826752.1 AAA family ATPase [Alphaproteobacteria bacterium]
MALFRTLEIGNWRQFHRIDIDLSKQITVLTGSNGTGKTSLLNILTQHFGWNLSFVSTPRIASRRLRAIWSDIYEDSIIYDEESANGKVTIGRIDYDDGNQCNIVTDKIVSSNYSLKYSGLQPVSGLYIPSHRPQAIHSPVQSIPTNPISSQQQYQEYQNLMIQAFGSQNIRNPGTVQKQSIIALAVFGEGNESVLPNPDYKKTFESLQRVLSIILPSQLEFRRLEIRSGDVVLVTGTGDFSLDAMSGGVNALFGIAWQLTMFQSANPVFTIVIDEPENHLHPSMQRLLLPNLAQAFPNSRIVVATHSPFIITSFPEANVYGLIYNENKRVISCRLETTELSGTPNQVLREVLNVDSNLPAWVAARIQQILSDPALGDDPKARGANIMQELARLGLADALVDFEA